MNKKSLALSAVFAVALSSMVSAGSITTSNGARCDDNYNFNENTGETVEFGLNTNASTGETSLSLTYKIELGGKKRTYGGSITRLDCSRMLYVEERKQELELQQMQLEIKLLKEQLAAAQKPQSTQSSDDW